MRCGADGRHRRRRGVDGNHPFCEEIKFLASNDIAQGYPDGTFRPDNGITRQAGAAFLQRFASLPPA